MTAGIVLQYAVRIVRQFSNEVQVRQQLQRSGKNFLAPGAGPSAFSRVDLRSRAWFNENLESRDFFVPGVVALLVSIVTLLLTSMAVVREKEIGTLEQMMVTPITRLDFILGKTVPFALIAFVDLFLVAAVGVYWFEIPFRGSLPLLCGATGLYILTTLGIGLLISTISQTQQQAMMSTFFFFFPAMLLSGFTFPIANMPEPVQWLTYIDPIRYFLVILRGIFLKGVGADILWPPMAVLAVMGVVTLALATRRLSKTMA
jgi:ABC-2 type transport system permease protein